MKKLLLTLVILTAFAVAAPAVFAQQFTVDGEVKTGLIWSKSEDGINDAKEDVQLGSKDDAGNGRGRFRVNMEYVNESGTMGFKTRLNWENWIPSNPKAPDFPYAFGYGNFFDDQLTLAIGLLGSSPWGTGGPEMWRELDNVANGGMRFEYKPSWVPGELNVGFVLNYFNSPAEASGDIKLTILEVLQESVLGISYTNDVFHGRFAFRLDSDYDQRVRGQERDGGDLVYRLEERAIKNYLPGFQVWALGYFSGVGGSSDECYASQNWLFVEYAPELFTAQLRTGVDVMANRTVLNFRPNFYWNFLDKFIVVGTAFMFAQDFGKRANEDAPFSYIELEPKIQVNFSPNAYVAFAYNWHYEYVREFPEHIAKGVDPVHQDQWINIRMGMTF